MNILTKYCKFFLVKDNKNKKIAFDEVNDVMNEDYIMIGLKDKNHTFIFNPYDNVFILTKIQSMNFKILSINLKSRKFQFI